MTKLTTANKKKLDHMNRAAHNVDLGQLLATLESGSATLTSASATQATQIVILQATTGSLASGSAALASGSAQNAQAITVLQGKAVTAGSVLVSSAQASASAVVINSGLGTVKGYVVQIYRSGSLVDNPYFVGNTAGSVSVMPVSGSYAVLTNDLIEYILW